MAGLHIPDVFIELLALLLIQLKHLLDIELLTIDLLLQNHIQCSLIDQLGLPLLVFNPFHGRQHFIKLSEVLWL